MCLYFWGDSMKLLYVQFDSSHMETPQVQKIDEYR